MGWENLICGDSICAGQGKTIHVEYSHKTSTFLNSLLLQSLLQRQEPEERKKSIEKAEYILRELEAMGRFHKYRQLKQRYLDEQ